MPVRPVRLSYGNDSLFEAEIDSDRLVAAPVAPRPNPQFKQQLLAALRRPLDFPSVEQAVIPGDRVTLALDRHTPGAATLVAGIWEVLAPRARSRTIHDRAAGDADGLGLVGSPG